VTGYLLDTNALLWLAFEPEIIAPEARRELFESPLYTSAISAAEIAIKASIGKLELAPPFQTDFGTAFRNMLDRLDVDLIPVGLEAIDHLRHLPLHHRDPFDRMIIAQALADRLAIATRDRAFAAYAGLEILKV
jgi:PIN domain nuclease of toxin-antitoxin system